jgi:hypothetical protein
LDFTAHQTTQQRYAMGIFRITIRKMSSHTVAGVYPPEKGSDPEGV